MAIVALHLGDASVARDMFQLRPDPIQRTLLIDTFPNWHGDVARLAPVVAQKCRRGIPLGRVPGNWRHTGRGSHSGGEAGVAVAAFRVVSSPTRPWHAQCGRLGASQMATATAEDSVFSLNQ